MALSKSIKKLVLALVILIVLMGIASLIINHLVNERLPTLLGENIQTEKVTIDIFGNKITFEKPSFILDSLESAPELRLHAIAHTVLISGFSIWDLLISKKIDVNHLTLDSLEVDILLPHFIASESEKKEINLFITDIFTKIEVDHFEVLSADFRVQERDSLKEVLAINGFKLSAEKILIDTATVQNVFPLEFGKSSVSIRSLFVQPNDQYIITAENMHIIDTTFSIENVQVESLYSKAEFPRHHPYEKARFSVFVAKLTSRKLVWQAKNDGKWRVNSERVDLDSMRLEVFKDKTPPDQPLNIKPLLPDLIHKIPISLSIDTLTLRGSYIEYEQRPVKYPRAGKVYFENLYMSAYNIVNDTARVHINPITTMDIKTRFMGKGKLSIVIKLDMSSEKQEFSVSGRLGEMLLTYVNQVLAPLSGVNATGNLHILEFEFSGDNYSSTGNMVFEYSDLHIDVFDKAREKEWLKSVFGNMILKNGNLKENPTGYKEGEIYFIRYQNRDFFNYLWNSLRVGLMDIVIPFYKNPDLITPPQNTKYKRED